MTPEEMLAVIEELQLHPETHGNSIQFAYEGVPEILIFDVHADRMRLASPILELRDLEEGMLERAMEANYHSTLDARYAVSDGLVWAAFIHPLSDLSPALFKSAVRQVAVARATFGDQYTSGKLFFGGPGSSSDLPN